MFRMRIISQTKISARGYLEIRSRAWTLLPVALLLAAFRLKARQTWITAGGLAFEAIDYLDKVFFYSYQPSHGRLPGKRRAGSRKLREVGYVLRLGIVPPGSHRRAAA